MLEKTVQDSVLTQANMAKTTMRPKSSDCDSVVPCAPDRRSKAELELLLRSLRPLRRKLPRSAAECRVPSLLEVLYSTLSSHVPHQNASPTLPRILNPWLHA